MSKTTTADSLKARGGQDTIASNQLATTYATIFEGGGGVSGAWQHLGRVDHDTEFGVNRVSPGAESAADSRHRFISRVRNYHRNWAGARTLQGPHGSGLRRQQLKRLLPPPVPSVPFLLHVQREAPNLTVAFHSCLAKWPRSLTSRCCDVSRRPKRSRRLDPVIPAGTSSGGLGSKRGWEPAPPSQAESLAG